MVYGVKIVHTHIVEEGDKHFYEEVILKVNADKY